MRLSATVSGVFIGVILQVTPASAQEAQFSNGFAALSEKFPEIVGSPLEAEHNNGESVVQRTTTGLLYWSENYAPTFTDGWNHYTLQDQWQGTESDPPKQSASSVQTTPLDPASYIRSHSRYGERAVCVSRIETGGWTAFYNPRGWPPPYYNEHAQGYFGWLPSTAAHWGVVIMNLDSEISGFDRMMDAGAVSPNGNTFYGIGHGC